ncbi:MAG: selenium metabolism-associated LysR family transcriptional regulator [Syntrophomonadaceae bacterium]|nr:selenium metabolism-associated LysR family transcriptional regulator [Syntrophomonadaceae bacterium]
MNLNLFKTYVRVIDTQNFSRTAEEIGISQPAVTKQIQSLEDIYGVMLLERSGRRLRPTEAGETLYQCAREIIRLVERTEREMQAMADSNKGSLTLGASTIPGQYLLPRLIKQYKDIHSQVSISLSISDSERVFNQVADRNLDVGIVGAWLNSRKVEGFPWMTDELVVIAPTNYQGGKGDSVRLSELHNEKWIIREKGSGTRRSMEELWFNAGLRRENLTIAMEAGSTEAVIAMVEAGMGISIVSRLALSSAAARLRCRELRIRDQDVTRQLYVIYPSQRSRRDSVNNFLEYLKAMKA